MPDGLPRTQILCDISPGLCQCPARHAPHSSFPCDNCSQRRKHARGCPATPYPGKDPRPCTCHPLPSSTFCHRRVEA